jgi:large subunit ribosomal protein L4
VEALRWKILNMDGKQVGEMDLDPEVFGAPVKKNLVHEVVRWQLTKRRSGTHQALTRSMMKGGGKKPWKQKGTGRARAGSIISPLWVGGASVHGPLPRSYEHRLAKRTRRQALAAVLSSKVKTNSLIVLDKLEMKAVKTKDFSAVLQKLGVNGKKVAFVLPEVSEQFAKSSRNVPRVHSAGVDGANVYDLVRHNILVSTKDGIEALTKRVKVIEAE